MRRKLGVALAVVAIALSGAREAANQFRQLKSLAGDWATTNAWNSLLVYAAGTFDGLAPQRQTPLVASASAPRGDARASAKRRAVKSAARRPARVRVETAEPLIAELALSHAEAAARVSEVEEFRVEVRRGTGAGAEALRRFAAEFETEFARGAEAGRARAESEASRLRVKDFVFKFKPAEAPKARAALRRNATRRRAEVPRDEARDAEGEAGAQDALFEPRPASGLFNCDEEPRR